MCIINTPRKPTTPACPIAGYANNRARFDFKLVSKIKRRLLQAPLKSKTSGDNFFMMRKHSLFSWFYQVLHTLPRR